MPGYSKEQSLNGRKEKKTFYSIPKKSKRRKSQEAEYKIIRDLWIQGKKCKRCGKNAKEVHHKRGRIESLLLDIRYWMAVCRNCHQWIETHPEESKELGYSENRL